MNNFDHIESMAAMERAEGREGERVSWSVQGEMSSRIVAKRLVSLSIPFQVEPWPDDEWRFETKREHEHLIPKEA